MKFRKGSSAIDCRFRYFRNAVCYCGVILLSFLTFLNKDYVVGHCSFLVSVVIGLAQHSIVRPY